MMIGLMIVVGMAFLTLATLGVCAAAMAGIQDEENER